MTNFAAYEVIKENLPIDAGVAARPAYPYEKLKRALRADIDEGAWSNLYSSVSRPFDKPESGKIAVKVINHYGDEVLKVFEV